MAFGENSLTTPVEKRSAFESEASSLKRRRITLQDVETELRVAGLCQPALSLVKSSGHAFEPDVETELRVAGLCQPALSLVKSSGHAFEPDTFNITTLKRSVERAEDLQTEVDKRRRVCAQVEPLYTAQAQLVPLCSAQARLEPVCYAEGESWRNGNSSLLPYSGGRTVWRPTTEAVFGNYPPVIPRPIDGPTSITIDPFGLTFAVGNGFLIADLPVGRRPACSFSGEQAAKIVIDSKGTALFLSDSGEILASVPAVRQLEDACDPTRKELMLQVLSVKDESDALPLAIRVSKEEGSASCEEVFSPSTDVPLEEDGLEGMDTD